MYFPLRNKLNVWSIIFDPCDITLLPSAFKKYGNLSTNRFTQTNILHWLLSSALIVGNYLNRTHTITPNNTHLMMLSKSSVFKLLPCHSNYLHHSFPGKYRWRRQASALKSICIINIPFTGRNVWCVLGIIFISLLFFFSLYRSNFYFLHC